LRGLRWRFALGLIKAAFHVAKAGGRPYQPVEIGGRRFDNVRDTDQRWQAVAQVLRDHGVKSVLDVGCAEGWFVRRAAADLNLFAIGIEATDAGVVGELARLHDRVPRAAAVRAFMTPEAIRGLSQFDAMLCLSVLHHVIRGFGHWRG
jgi:2-polyprenyl-3-methyl-5-hydroxy-6-metoxy-1,4-benzoquinol methylase